MIGGYPTADADGILAAAQVDGAVVSAGGTGSAAILYVAPGGGTADAASTCKVTYTAANTTAGSEAPASVVAVTGGCN